MLVHGLGSTVTGMVTAMWASSRRAGRAQAGRARRSNKDPGQEPSDRYGDAEMRVAP